MFSQEPNAPMPAATHDRLPTYRTTERDRMKTAMVSDGVALIPDVLTTAEVEAARAKIDELKPIHWDFTGPTDHFKNVFNRDPFWLSFLDRPGVIDIAETVLGDNCHIIGQTAWKNYPDHRGIGLHVDYLPMEWPEPGMPENFNVPMFLCTAHFYLSPQTSELCPTHVIPGSHRAGRKPKATEVEWHGRACQPVLCDAGDVLFFRSDLWHRGSDNQTRDQIRYLLQVHYGRREMAQHFAPYLDWRFDPAVIAACSPRQLRLLGDHPEAEYD
jgi:hypothetical protein